MDSLSLRIRIIIFGAGALVALAILGRVYWVQEIQYLLPTPVPADLHEVAIGDTLPSLAAYSDGKPLFIHFYNPDCPCSRFNVKDFEKMVHRYGDQFSFIAFIQAEENDPKSLTKFISKHSLGIPVYLDVNGQVAEMLGVYATPQAVILDANNVLYYKGNYNRARFCSSRETAFAEIALNNFIEGKAAPIIPEVAYQAYGCTLPSNEEENPHDAVTAMFKNTFSNFR